MDGWSIANAVDREGEHMTGQGKQGDHTKGRKPFTGILSQNYQLILSTN